MAAEADAMTDPAKKARARGSLAQDLHPTSWRTRPGLRSSTSSASPCTAPRGRASRCAVRRSRPHPGALRRGVRCQGWPQPHHPQGASSLRLEQRQPAEAEVAPGDRIEFETVDSSGAQLAPKSTLADLAKLDFGKVNPVTGPVHVDGAAPGDALKVTITSSRPRAGAGRRTSRASGCSPTSSRSRRCISGNTTAPSWAPRPTGRAGGCR